jgi:hypothetical protein
MVMSALSAPIYARSLLDAVLRRKSKFVVTPKGDSASPDTLFGTFRVHWFFILIFAGSLMAGVENGHSHPAMITWTTFALLITASPILAWRYMVRQEKKQSSAVLPDEPQDAVPPPQALPVAHGPQQKPSWVASGTGSGGGEQTMQIALGGLGGRKE